MTVVAANAKTPKAAGVHVLVANRETGPNEPVAVAALEQGIATTNAGQTALLEFITDKEFTISDE